MATATGYTAAKMQEFADASVVSGTVVGTNLHLTTQGGTVIDAGNVQGPAGQDAQAVMTVTDSPTVDLTLTGAGTTASPWNIKADLKTYGTSTQRDAYFGVPTVLADKVTLANLKVIWYNTDKGWWESYLAVTGSAGLTANGLLSGWPEGWYPIQSNTISAHKGITNGFQTVDGTKREVVFASAQMRTGGITDGASASALVVPIGGIYEIRNRLYATGGSNCLLDFEIRVNNNLVMDVTQWKEDGNDYRDVGALEYPLKANDAVTIWSYGTGATNTWGTTGYNGSFLEMVYKRPPFANF